MVIKWAIDATYTEGNRLSHSYNSQYAEFCTEEVLVTRSSLSLLIMVKKQCPKPSSKMMLHNMTIEHVL